MGRGRNGEWIAERAEAAAGFELQRHRETCGGGEPVQHPAQDLRKLVLERFNLSLGSGLGKLTGRAFRIGHLGDFNELMLGGTLCGVEMGLSLSGIPLKEAGVAAALQYLTEQA